MPQVSQGVVQIHSEWDVAQCLASPISHHRTEWLVTAAPDIGEGLVARGSEPDGVDGALDGIFGGAAQRQDSNVL